MSHTHLLNYKSLESSAVRVDYFCSRLLVDYLSTSRRLFFVQYTNYFSTLYVSK